MSTGTLESAVAVVARTGPVRPRPEDALRRYWPIVLVCVAAFVAAGIALGLRRAPEYTAKARLSVGRIFVNNAAAVPGVLQASETLAGNYSRAIEATAVVASAHRLAHLEGGSISASPIPGSTLITVSAKAGSAEAAVRLANAASVALTRYVSSQTRSGPSVQAAFSQYEQAALDYQRKLDVQTKRDKDNTESPSPSTQRALDRAAAAAQAALLRRDTLGSIYEGLVQGGTASPNLQPFSRATEASSDRRSTLRLLIVIGFVSGFAVGVALALLWANRRAARAAVVDA